MVNGMIENDRSESTKYLKNIFEQSLAVLCEDKNSAAAETHLRRLRHGSLPLHIDAINLQKRALIEAAQALAALWKISERSQSKLPSSALKYRRSPA